MAVKIRLTRMGSKKKPYYRINVADSRSPRDGRFIETVGTYNPLVAEKQNCRWTMDTIENLIIAIVKPLISQPDALTIKIEDTPEFLEYHLDLDPSDVGRVIGRKGRTISAIRTIVYSVPTEDKKVRIVIDEK